MLKTSKIINRYGGFRVSQSRRKTKRWKIKLCYNSLRLKDIKVNLFIIINLWMYEYVSLRARFSKLSNRINHLFLYFHNNNNRIETEEIGRKELIERLNYYNCRQIHRGEHFRERHRVSRSFLLERPFLSLSLPSREFSEAHIIGFVTVLSANRPIILRCILLGINLPFCFWVTAFDRFRPF